MYEEKKFGGRNFTIKKTSEKGITTLIISISDLIETLREVIATNVPRVKEIAEYHDKHDYKNAMEKLSKYLIDTMFNLSIENTDFIFNINFDLINWDKDFDYEHTIKINSKTEILKFTVRKQAWNSTFIKCFVEDYNNYVKGEK